MMGVRGVRSLGWWGLGVMGWDGSCPLVVGV